MLALLIAAFVSLGAAPAFAVSGNSGSGSAAQAGYPQLVPGAGTPGAQNTPATGETLNDENKGGNGGNGEVDRQQVADTGAGGAPGSGNADSAGNASVEANPDSLPFTGFAALVLLGAGLALAGAGLMLRRRTRVASA